MSRSLVLAVALALIVGCQPPLETGDSALLSARLAKQVLIVTDELDRMEPLAAFLGRRGVESTIIDYTTLPEEERRLPHNVSQYDALVGYIHNELNEPTELAIIGYTTGGGRFVAVHHMVSSGKSKNAHYFDFLGLRLDDIQLAREPAEPGGHYMWREPVRKVLVNLDSDHYITNHAIEWPERVPFRPTDVPGAAEAVYPAVTLPHTEVYANVKRIDGDAKSLLLGYVYRDERNGVTHSQATDGWTKRAGQGHIVYIQPGHFVAEFSNPESVLNRLILNAINWQPARE